MNEQVIYSLNTLFQVDVKIFNQEKPGIYQKNSRSFPLTIFLPGKKTVFFLRDFTRKNTNKFLKNVLCDPKNKL